MTDLITNTTTPSTVILRFSIDFDPSMIFDTHQDHRTGMLRYFVAVSSSKSDSDNSDSNIINAIGSDNHTVAVVFGVINVVRIVSIQRLVGHISPYYFTQ